MYNKIFIDITDFLSYMCERLCYNYCACIIVHLCLCVLMCVYVCQIKNILFILIIFSKNVVQCLLLCVCVIVYVLLYVRIINSNKIIYDLNRQSYKQHM